MTFPTHFVNFHILKVCQVQDKHIEAQLAKNMILGRITGDSNADPNG